jgi:hypothetical protein
MHIYLYNKTISHYYTQITNKMASNLSGKLNAIKFRVHYIVFNPLSAMGALEFGFFR